MSTAQAAVIVARQVSANVRGEETPGLWVVARRHTTNDESSSNDWIFRVALSTGQVYAATVSQQDMVKSLKKGVTLEDLERVLQGNESRDGADDDDDKNYGNSARTAFEVKKGPDSLHVKITEPVSKSKLVRTIWSAELALDEGTTAWFDVTMQVLRHVQQAGQAQQQEQEELQQAQENIAIWKDTATKLEGAWQSEKDELVDNFLVLYNQKQDQVDELQKQLQGLRIEHDELRDQLEGNQRRHSRRHEPDALDNVPDDKDQEMFDAETVERLAARPDSANTATKSKPAKKEKATTSRKKMPEATKPPRSKVKLETNNDGSPTEQERGKTDDDIADKPGTTVPSKREMSMPVKQERNDKSPTQAVAPRDPATSLDTTDETPTSANQPVVAPPPAQKKPPPPRNHDDSSSSDDEELRQRARARLAKEEAVDKKAPPSTEAAAKKRPHNTAAAKPVAAQKKAKTAAATTQRSTSGSKAAAGQDNSEDDELYDADMRDDIHARLAAMRDVGSSTDSD